LPREGGFTPGISCEFSPDITYGWCRDASYRNYGRCWDDVDPRPATSTTARYRWALSARLAVLMVRQPGRECCEKPDQQGNFYLIRRLCRFQCVFPSVKHCERLDIRSRLRSKCPPKAVAGCQQPTVSEACPPSDLPSLSLRDSLGSPLHPFSLWRIGAFYGPFYRYSTFVPGGLETDRCC